MSGFLKGSRSQIVVQLQKVTGVAVEPDYLNYKCTFPPFRLNEAIYHEGCIHFRLPSVANPSEDITFNKL